MDTTTLNELRTSKSEILLHYPNYSVRPSPSLIENKSISDNLPGSSSRRYRCFISTSPSPLKSMSAAPPSYRLLPKPKRISSHGILLIACGGIPPSTSSPLFTTLGTTVTNNDTSIPPNVSGVSATRSEGRGLACHYSRSCPRIFGST
ncbi:hypothetical protein M413DRAFT_271650 [Hebeloma cylindrosporum]|uniref:Uncharacterized protein n=1 Tax=Hebeloma cylindrosporum TaxID=76867 RepID=A0A0C3CT35_HEBCY|nr:hypothetical protein M413DRAFT_271650 [Hebeloma cylindrosporum h7]